MPPREWVARNARMSVRAARAEDRSELLRMRRSLWPDSTEAEVEEVLEMEPGAGVVLVHDRGNGRLGGFAELALRKFADGCSSSHVAYLEGIWTDADQRHDGVARALVEAGQRWARGLGLTELASDCEIDNSASHGFHLAVGFEEVQRTINFRRSLTGG
jgi:aminoglycoside 6'-N-acetyltransferase I